MLEAVALVEFYLTPGDVSLRVRERVAAGVREYEPYGFHRDGEGRADKLLELHVRPSRIASARIGDIIGLDLCWPGPRREIRAILSGYYE